VALAVAYPMKWFYAMMYPFITVLNNSANGFLRLFGISPAAATEMAHSEEELRVLFTQSQKQGTLSSDKLDLLENIIDFSTLTVRQIMVPRTEVAAFDLRKSLSGNLEIAERTAHSRYPLVDGDLDHVVGVIHMKDLFWQLKDMEEPHTAAETAERRNPMIAGGDIALHPPSSGAHFLSAIAREVLFVPETMRIDLLLKEFQLKRIHLAMVVDEYGGTSGMVTFENVIEEIVGEVQDEFDEEAPRIKKINERDYIIEGITTLSEVNDALATELESEEADTIGGFFLSALGRIPKPGDRIEVEGVEMTVREMRRQHIHRLLVKLIPQAGEDEKETAEAGKQENGKPVVEQGKKEL
jgi:CBS domain containing-hemolysin-like protein